MSKPINQGGETNTLKMQSNMQVSQWFRIRDSYGVDIQPGQDDALILAITVVIDQMTSDVA